MLISLNVCCDYSLKYILALQLLFRLLLLISFLSRLTINQHKFFIAHLAFFFLFYFFNSTYLYIFLFQFFYYFLISEVQWLGVLSAYFVFVIFVSVLFRDPGSFNPFLQASSFIRTWNKLPHNELLNGLTASTGRVDYKFYNY